MSDFLVEDRLTSASAMIMSIQNRLLQCMARKRVSRGVAVEVRSMCEGVADMFAKCSSEEPNVGTIKVLRCVWVVRRVDVDQYGNDVGNHIEYSEHGTYEEAAADRPRFGRESQHVKDRWLPNDGDNGYRLLEIAYVEKLIR